MKSPQDAGRLVIMHFNCLAITLLALLSSALAVPTPILGIRKDKSNQIAPNPSQNAAGYPLNQSKGKATKEDWNVPPTGTTTTTDTNPEIRPKPNLRYMVRNYLKLPV